MKKKRGIRTLFASETLAVKFTILSLLIVFFGIQYQRLNDKSLGSSRSTDIDKSTKLTINNFHPDKLVVIRQENKVFNLDSFKKTFTDESSVQELYVNLEGFKQLPPSAMMSCPYIPWPYEPVNYILEFYKGDAIKQRLIFTPPGCRNTIKFENNEVREGITKESVTFSNTLQNMLNMTATQFRGYGRE